jgi:hypothetical protein
MNDNSEMMKVLETIADRLVDMHLSNNRRFDELAAQLEARLPAKVGEQLSLLAIVTAAEAVVPNEDEAMPVVETQPPLVADPSWEVLASCPSCSTKAYTEKGVEEMFGYRTPAGRETIRQSWCRYCRTDGKDKTPKSNRKAPTYWSKTDSQAAAFTAAATAARNAILPLAYRLANDTLTPSERAGLMSRVEVLEGKHKAAKSDYQKRVKQLGYVHPPTKPKGDK